MSEQERPFEQCWDRATPLLRITAGEPASEDAAKTGSVMTSIEWTDTGVQVDTERAAEMLLGRQATVEKLMTDCGEHYGQPFHDALNQLRPHFNGAEGVDHHTGATWSETPGKTPGDDGGGGWEGMEVPVHDMTEMDMRTGTDVNSALHRLRDMREDGCTGLVLAVDEVSADDQTGFAGGAHHRLRPDMSPEDVSWLLGYAQAMVVELTHKFAHQTQGPDGFCQEVTANAGTICRARRDQRQSDESG